MHAILHVRNRTKETDTMPLAWDPLAQVANLGRQLQVLKLFKTLTPKLQDQRRPRSLRHRSTRTSALRPGPRRTIASDLERANSNPNTHTHNLHGRDPCPSSCCQQSSHHRISAKTLFRKAPIVLHRSQQATVLAASQNVDRKALFQVNWQYDVCILSLLDFPRCVIRPAPNCAHNQYHRIRRAKPQVGGFQFDVLLNDAANFRQTSANAMGRSFRRHGCDAAQVQVSLVRRLVGNRGRRPQFRCLVCCHCLCTRAHPFSQRNWPAFGAPVGQQCQHFANRCGRVRPPAQHPWPLVSPTSLEARILPQLV